MNIGKKDSPIDVLLITAVKDELDVVRKAEPDWQEQEDSKGFSYYTRKVIGNAGNEFTIAAARPIDMGGDFAANIATRLVNELKPCCLAMVGICAGWREKVFLGDVIVAKRVFRYDAGKLKAFRNGDIRTEEFFPDICTYNLKPLWVQKAQDFPSDWISTIQTKRPLSYSYQELWLLYALDAFESRRGKNPLELEERKTHCPDWAEVLNRLEDKGLIEVAESLKLTEEGKRRVDEHKIRYPDGILPEQDKPETYVAPMGTGSQVKEDTELFPAIAHYMQKVHAIEMEAAAIGAVAEIENVGSFIIVKGVADYADPEKDDHFRFYAIEASYRFLMAFLKENLITVPEIESGEIYSNEEIARIDKIFVPPKNFEDAKQKLNDDRLLILIGPGSIGKTTMGLKLLSNIREIESRVQRNIINPNPTAERLIRLKDRKNSLIFFDAPFGGVHYPIFTIRSILFKLNGILPVMRWDVVKRPVSKF